MRCGLKEANEWEAGRAQAHAVVSDVIFKALLSICLLMLRIVGMVRKSVQSFIAIT
jgi:hypothetical protein